MSKIPAFQTVADDDYAIDNPHGEVSAFTIIQVRDIFGQDRHRRVSLGRCPVSLSEAKKMIKTAREAQPSQQVSAQFTVYL